MELDYKSIGQRIRTCRLRKSLTQEQLAELSGVSPTHMSNIETGTTHVSLTAIVSIANALNVTADDLLCDNLHSVRAPYEQDYADLLSDCSAHELRLITATASALKSALRAKGN